MRGSFYKNIPKKILKYRLFPCSISAVKEIYADWLMSINCGGFTSLLRGGTSQINPLVSRSQEEGPKQGSILSWMAAEGWAINNCSQLSPLYPQSESETGRVWAVCLIVLGRERLVGRGQTAGPYPACPLMEWGVRMLWESSSVSHTTGTTPSQSHSHNNNIILAGYVRVIRWPWISVEKIN